MEILPNMIDNGNIQCSDDKEIIYTKDYVYVHKDIEKVEIEDNGMTSVVYKCHEYKYPVMEYIELTAGYKNKLVDRNDLIQSYTNWLCGGDGLTLDNVKLVTGVSSIDEFLSIDEYKEVLHKVLKNAMKTKRKTVTVAYDNDVFDANEDAQNNMMVLLKSLDLGATTAYIRSTNETTHALTKAQCNELSVLMLQAVQNLYATYWQLKDKLAKCTTYDELNNFDLTWPKN